MDNNELQEFDLDDILNEFHEDNEGDALDPEALEAALSDALFQEDEEEEPAQEEAAPSQEEELPQEEAPRTELSQDTLARLDSLIGEDAEETQESEEPAPQLGDTIRMNEIIKEVQAAEKAEEAAEEDPAVSEDATVRVDIPDMEDLLAEESDVDAEEIRQIVEEEPAAPPVIEFNPKLRLRELKKKLVAGPEKRFYELSEQGVGRVQMAILMSLLITCGCAAVATMYAMDLIPENRLRLVIFSQILAMLLSALFGCHQMMEGLGELLRGRFTLNTLLNVTFLSCCADAYFCLQELRIPCCAAFSLHVTMALWARYQRRSTEMAQMDTLRKAVRLRGLTKEDDCYEGKPAILRFEGHVEDFMDNYEVPSGPQKLQNAYAFISLFACVGIAVFAGLLHGISLGVQVFSTTLLVAIPASFFVALTRPMAILEKRLHMVGTVLCGWQGVKGLCGSAAFPLRDEDLFPHGSTKLNGVKFYGDRDPDEVVSYTTSLICAAGGGLVNVFRQLLSSRDGVEHSVENFRNYGDGGIGGEVCGEPVLLGTPNFLRDMGVEIPEGSMVSQAVYASIDGQLSAVFAISYAKMRSAAAGLVTLSGYRKLTPVLTGGDFMITDSMLKSKFGINTRRVAFPDREVRQDLASRQADPDSVAMAMATRDELVSYAYAVTGSRALRASCRLGMILHLAGGILGMLIMLVLGYLGSTELLIPTHILLYQLVWLVPGLLITEWSRTV